MERIKQYISESYEELMKHVSWPTWENLQGSTVLVLISSLIIAFLIFLMDLISKQGMTFIYGLG